MKSKVFLVLILTLCIMMLFVTSSAAEAKMGGVLIRRLREIVY